MTHTVPSTRASWPASVSGLIETIEYQATNFKVIQNYFGEYYEKPYFWGHIPELLRGISETSRLSAS